MQKSPEPGGYQPRSRKATSPGSGFDPDYRRRPMTCYPVSDSELEMLSSSDTFAGLFSALGTFAAGTAVTLWLGVGLASVPLGAVPQFLWDYVLKALVVITALCFVVAGIFWFRRRTLLDKIKSESYTVEIGVSKT